MTLGEQIRAAREQKNLSQEELAEYMGVSRQAVSKWENGASVPHGANRSKLAEFLGLEPEPPEAPGKKPGGFPWIGWALAAVLLLVLAGVLIYRKSAPSDSPDEPPMTSDNEDAAAQPAVQSVRFYNETQEELVPLPPQQSYNVLQMDSILIQWTGGESPEWVKMFYTPIGGKTELAEEFKGPSVGGSALLIPADALRREGQAHLYFELHFTDNYTVTTDEFRLYYDDGYTILTYIEDFDGKLLTFDMVEWVDPISDPARAEELGITDEATPNGFYIYNEQDAAARRLVAEDCVYTVLDWYHNYAPVTVSASEFQSLLGERSSLSSGIPYDLTIAEDQIVGIREQYIP